VQAIVVAPILGIRNDVVGALYGTRCLIDWARDQAFGRVEAAVVQLLAAAVDSFANRATALRTRVQFEQFFSAQLVCELERQPSLLDGRTQEVTVLVSDLRHFTAISERVGPAITFPLVQDTMERLSNRIFEHGGVIVDYAGDGILAMWNAPMPQRDHAALACRAAVAMQQEMTGLNASWRAKVGEALRLGIGLNTGPAQVGNTGSARKFKYGPHGSSVNLASRVQGATKQLGVPILITEATQKQLPDDFRTQFADKIPLDGVAEDVPLHELQEAPDSMLRFKGALAPSKLGLR
jgi:adenylate cyclase